VDVVVGQLARKGEERREGRKGGGVSGRTLRLLERTNQRGQSKRTHPLEKVGDFPWHLVDAVDKHLLLVRRERVDDLPVFGEVRARRAEATVINVGVGVGVAAAARASGSPRLSLARYGRSRGARDQSFPQP